VQRSNALDATGPAAHPRAPGPRSFRIRLARVARMIDPGAPAPLPSLVACWLGERWCERYLFNLKLPMKRRTEALCHASPD
jgi:23S rRNA C2498 (ribose-2'-O)-methylase RlmM